MICYLIGLQNPVELSLSVYSQAGHSKKICLEIDEQENSLALMIHSFCDVLIGEHDNRLEAVWSLEKAKPCLLGQFPPISTIEGFENLSSSILEHRGG